MRGFLKRILVFAALTGGFAMAALAVPRISYHFAHLLPDNYRYIAADATKRGDFHAAAAIARRRLEQHFYDFDAMYILADAQAGGGDPLGAAATMKEILKRVPGARAKRGPTSGYDEPRTIYLLAKYLWDAGQYFEACEMARAAIDTGLPVAATYFSELVKKGSSKTSEETLALARLSLKLGRKAPFEKAVAALEGTTSSTRATARILTAQWAEAVDRSTTAAEIILATAADEYPEYPAVRLALSGLLRRTGRAAQSETVRSEAMLSTGSRVVALDTFKLSTTGKITTESVSIFQNGEAAANFSTGVFRVNFLLLQVFGSRALGMHPMVTIKSAGKELCRIYADGLQPHIYSLELWPQGAPKWLDLRFEFTNDIFDPYMKADRNVSISGILLH